MKINCIGDSHVSIFYGEKLLGTTDVYEKDIFTIKHAGPILAFNIAEKSDVFNLCVSYPKNEHILLCFGEIDCRAQVGRHITETKNYKMVIDEIVSRYIQFADSIENKNIILWGVSPCLKEKPFEKWFGQFKFRQDLFYATRGTKEERNEYKRYFNKELERICKIKGFKYLSIYEEVLENDDLYLDDIHLSGEKVFEIIRSKF